MKFKVYQDAKKLHKEIALITKRYPRSFYYLKDQLRRSSLSIVLQIAEGSAKRSDKDFNRYLEMGMGSANETASGLEVSFEERLITEEKYNGLIKLSKKK